MKDDLAPFNELLQELHDLQLTQDGLPARCAVAIKALLDRVKHRDHLLSTKAVERDAARYRWLRDTDTIEYGFYIAMRAKEPDAPPFRAMAADELNECIDAAMCQYAPLGEDAK